MRLEFNEKEPFDAQITELLTVQDGEEVYNIEVNINYGFGLEETEIEVSIKEHGLNSDKIDEITEFVESQFKNVQYNRQLCN